MIDKTIVCDKVEKLETIASHYSVKKMNEIVKELKNKVDNFDEKLVFIGHFNAGKSSLVNGLIQRPGFLKEDIVPATAVATELNYSEEEYACVFKDTGTVKYNLEKVPIDSNINRIAYYINAPALKSIEDFTVVDTPGFDSGIEKHNKALNEYIPYGACYILVVSLEKGTIDNQTLEVIREISNYSTKMAVLLSKRDKITQANAEAIKTEVEDTLMAEGIETEVYLVSKYDSDISEKIVDIVSTFNAQDIFNESINNILEDNVKILEDILCDMLKNIENFETFEYEKKLKDYNGLKDKLSESLKKQGEKLKDEYADKVDEVKLNVKAALEAKEDAFIKAASGGGASSAEAVIVETIRPVLIRYINDYCVDAFSSLEAGLEDAVGKFEGDQINLEEKVENLGDIIEPLKSLGEQLNKKAESEEDKANSTENSEKDKANSTENSEKEKMNFEKNIKGFVNSKEGKATDEKSSKKSRYRWFTSMVGILTNYLPPILEVIIVLAPDIFGLIKHFSRNNELRDSYRNAIIPRIISKLHDPISTALKTTNVNIMKKAETEVNAKIEAIMESIKEINEKINAGKDDVEQTRKTIEEDLWTLKELI